MPAAKQEEKAVETTEEEAPAEPVEIDPESLTFAQAQDIGWQVVGTRVQWAASVMTEPFKFGKGKAQDSGVILIPSNGEEPLVIETEEYERDYAPLAPSRQF